MQHRKKIENVKLRMEFNPSMQRYEPELPVKKLKKSGVKVNWIEIAVIIIFMILIGVFLIFLTK